MANIWQTFTRGRRAVRGVAWAAAWTVPYLDEDFGAGLYFHSGTTSPGTWASGGIPIVRTVENLYARRFAWVRHLPALVDAGYSGPVIFGNEPDRPDQDNATPESFAGQYAAAAWWLTQALGPRYSIRSPNPQIDLIVGNAIDPGWTARLLPLITLRSHDTIGIHAYEDARLPGQPGWTWPSERIARVRQLAGQRWPGKIWVTEYGVEHAWPVDVARRYIDEVEQSPHVSHAFAYTSHAGDYSEHARRFGFYAEAGSRELTTAGQAYRGAK